MGMVIWSPITWKFSKRFWPMGREPMSSLSWNCHPKRSITTRTSPVKHRTRQSDHHVALLFLWRSSTPRRWLSHWNRIGSPSLRQSSFRVTQTPILPTSSTSGTLTTRLRTETTLPNWRLPAWAGSSIWPSSNAKWPTLSGKAKTLRPSMCTVSRVI